MEITNPRTLSLIKSYLTVKIGNFEIPCPYWCNKIRDGKVVARGFENGKGSIELISKEINRIASLCTSTDEIITLTKQNRIGIDCSGLVYRILETIINSNELTKMFPDGINRTNADLLTHNIHIRPIAKTREIEPGDLIRMMNGHHILFVTNNDGEKIEYIHSSGKTKEWGVHRGSIEILYPEENLECQNWMELTSINKNFGKEYFHVRDGDTCVRY